MPGEVALLKLFGEGMLGAEALNRCDALEAPQDVVADLAQLLLALLLQDEELL